jgi:hypothetical protein
MQLNCIRVNLQIADFKKSRQEAASSRQQEGGGAMHIPHLSIIIWHFSQMF